MNNIYIPTTTLNFNNILSTESISPKSFYINRKYGYRRFEMVEANKYDHLLVGYSKIPIFSIEDSERDNYPLILEISKEIIKDIKVIDRVEDIEIYQISKTIYLHPTKVKFLFLKDEDKKITLIKAQPSIETKLLPLYQNSIDIYTQNNAFEWKEKYLYNIHEKPIGIDKEIYNDRTIDKIKGFYYCYVLGEIYLKEKLKYFIIQKLNENEELRKNAKNKLDYTSIQKINIEENKFLEENISNINFYEDINFSHFKLTSFTNPRNKKSAELYKNIINDILEFNSIQNREEFKAHKFEFLKRIGDNFKETFGKEDETVEYIRYLLKNIKNFEQFDINNIAKDKEPILLKSIAYFILRGDDLEKLLNTLKEKNLATFKISFGLWGALFGFSAIPKTILDILFKENTKEIIDIEKFLKDMYHKIHNFKIEENIKISFIKEDVLEIENIFKEGNNINNIQIEEEILISPESLLNIIYKYIKNKEGIAKISDIVKYFKKEKIKIPNTKRQFQIKDIESLIKNHEKFKSIKIGNSKGLQIS